MKGMKLLLLSLLIALLSPAAFADIVLTPVYEARGEARDIKTGQLLYIELHHRDGMDHSVDYFLPDGKLIVTNKQNFQYSAFVPTVEQTDLRDNEHSGLQRKNNDWVLFNNDQREIIEHDDPLVASAGFDSFIRQNWAALSAGKYMDFDFAVPQSMAVAPLRLTPIDCKKADISRVADDALCLEVTPSSVFFSLFFDPIEVAYDRSSRRLLVYRGLTNLDDANGETYEAEIFYEYAALDERKSKKTAFIDPTE
jgi:hypothetical protein